MRTHRPARTWLAALLSLIAISLVTVPAAAQEQLKIAVIDLARAIADTEDGIRVKAELQELYDARQSEYEVKEKALQDAKAEYDELVKAGKTKESKLRKRLIGLEKMAYELQVAQYNYRREMQQKEYTLMQPIIRTMLGLVRKLASKDGYSMVLNKEAVPFFRSDLDITDRVVQMYNAARAAKKEADKPKPKQKGKKKAKPKKKKAKPKAKGGGSKASAKPKKKAKAKKKKAKPKKKARQKRN